MDASTAHKLAVSSKARLQRRARLRERYLERLRAAGKISATTTPKPDPERWLPRHQRKNFRKRMPTGVFAFPEPHWMHHRWTSYAWSQCQQWRPPRRCATVCKRSGGVGLHVKANGCPAGRVSCRCGCEARGWPSWGQKAPRQALDLSRRYSQA